MRLCPKCGKIILEDSIKFCDECGADLEAKPVETGSTGGAHIGGGTAGGAHAGGGTHGGSTGGARVGGGTTGGSTRGTRVGGGSAGGNAGGTHGGRGGSIGGGTAGGNLGGGASHGGNRGGLGGGTGSGGVKPWMIVLGALAVAVIGLAIGVIVKTNPPDDGGSTAEESAAQTEAYTQAENSTGETAPLQPSNGNGEAEAPAENDAAAEVSEESVTEGSDATESAEGTEDTANTADNQDGQTNSNTQTLPPLVVLTPTAAPTPSAYNDSADVHEYEVIVSDVTWQQAYDNCLAMGGHLLRINSKAEWDAVIQMLNAGGHDKIHFYLGGACDIATKQYHWVDDQEQFFDENIADQNLWYKEYWYPGEPSYQDQANGRVIDEYWMNLMCVSGTWYLNDTNNDLVGLYPDWLKGKVGYIVEYE